MKAFSRGAQREQSPADASETAIDSSVYPLGV
jgi:hypothetical protein